MAGSLCTAEANAILTLKFRTTTNYGVLLTASPTDAGTLTNEVANASAYVRPATTFGSDAAAREISNTGDLTFAAASGGDWGTVTHLAFAISATWNSIIFAWGPLTTSKLIEDGDQIKFVTGNITITFAAGTE